MTDTGNLPELDSLNSDAAIGNFAFGQGELTATPVQIANLFACIGNGGILTEPRLIYGYTDKNGALSPLSGKEGTRVLSENTCNILKEALSLTTIDGTGKRAFSSLYTCCSKTATAQSGQYDENGNEILYCWFAGFFPADNPKYAICVMKENGISGGTDCAPVFKEIAEGIIAVK
jgi:penicillin-binding protein 2